MWWPTPFTVLVCRVLAGDYWHSLHCYELCDMPPPLPRSVFFTPFPIWEREPGGERTAIHEEEDPCGVECAMAAQTLVDGA